MKIILNNRSYQINIEYLGKDSTFAALVEDFGKDKPTKIIADAMVTRHHSDPPRSKAKRRTFAISKLLRRSNFTRPQRAETWMQLWGQMNVPVS